MFSLLMWYVKLTNGYGLHIRFTIDYGIWYMQRLVLPSAFTLFLFKEIIQVSSVEPKEHPLSTGILTSMVTCLSSLKATLWYYSIISSSLSKAIITQYLLHPITSLLAIARTFRQNIYAQFCQSGSGLPLTTFIYTRFFQIFIFHLMDIWIV